MNWLKIIKRIVFAILKGIAAALAVMLGMVLGGVLTTLLGMQSPSVPPQASIDALLPLMFLSAVLAAIVVGECFQKLPLRYLPRMLSIWLCVYLLYYALNNLDAFLFSPVPHMSTSFVSYLANSLLAALVIAWLWKPEEPNRSISLREYFTTRKPGDWVWRFLLAWLVYPPIYYLVGRAVAPFVKSYYTDPSLNLGLTLPPVETLLAMQVLRGALFLLAVLPIIFFWQGSRRSLWLWSGTLIFILIAGSILIMSYWLPLGLRIPHALELLVDSFLQAGAYALLLFSAQTMRFGVTPVPVRI